MAFLFNDDFSISSGKRLTGFPRYKELIDRDFKRFWIINLFTILGFLPFTIGVIYALLSSSLLVLLFSCLIGGVFAGPALSGMYDAILRSLRDAPGTCMENYRRAIRQNFKQSILPGIIFCFMTGIYLFMLLLFYMAVSFPSIGTIVVYLFSLILFTMFFVIYWSQLVLFEQTNIIRIKNCILFINHYFKKVLLISVLNIFYIVLILLFLPWSSILIIFFGFWFPIFLSTFILYDGLNESFKIEEQINATFPEQIPYYEDDNEWLQRKEQENTL